MNCAKKRSVKTHPRVHFIGIGGIGMSALTRYFLSENWQVSGSDLSPSSITDELKKEGVAINIGKHSANNLRSDAALVIYNQAILKNNPELKKAKTLGIPCRSYPQAIAELTKKYRTIAIAGAHGKSTTTAMTALILIKGGFDPTVIIGTKLKEFKGKNFRKGKSDWLLLEADEWKASFLNYFPYLGAITNIDKEHLDFYTTFTNVKKAFAQFRKQCRHLVRAPQNAQLKSKIKQVLKIPGEHNIKNALLAYSIGRFLKIPHKTILKALGEYQGAWRRMEFRGNLRISSLIPNSKFPIPIYDDYAHHPTEIKATLAAFKEKWPKNALICVFQAHQVERLKRLFGGFIRAFKCANKVIILPTYEVAGRENSKKPDINNRLSKKLADAIGAIYIRNPQKHLKKTLVRLAEHTLSPIIVMMGAGDIVKYTDLLLKS